MERNGNRRGECVSIGLAAARVVRCLAPCATNGVGDPVGAGDEAREKGALAGETGGNPASATAGGWSADEMTVGDAVHRLDGSEMFAEAFAAWGWVEDHLGGLANEEIALPLRILDAAAGEFKPTLVLLNPDEGTACLHGGNASGARTHEGVADCLVGLREVGDKFGHQAAGLLGGVRALTFAAIDDVRVNPALAASIPTTVATSTPSGHEALKAARRTLAIKARRAVGLHPCAAGVVFRPGGLESIAPSTDTLCQREQQAPALRGFDTELGDLVSNGVDAFEAKILNHLLPIVPADAADGSVKFVLVRRIADDVVDGDRRQNLAAITQIQRRASDCFNAHLPPPDTNEPAHDDPEGERGEEPEEKGGHAAARSGTNWRHSSVTPLFSASPIMRGQYLGGILPRLRHCRTVTGFSSMSAAIASALPPHTS